MAQTDRTAGLVGHTGIKQPVRAATTANITLSGEQTIDGIACVTDDRVLVKNQTTASENGIYVVDTGTWSRAKDFNGVFDIVSGTMVRVNQGSTNGDGWFIVSTADPITIGTTELNFSRQSINFTTLVSATASAGQTLFNLGSTYQQGGHGISVFVNGLRQRLGADYDETSTSSITFTYALQDGDEIDVYIGAQVGSLTAALAALVAIVDAGDFFIGTSVEAVLQELVDAVTADVGNASATLTWGSSTPIQRWNTALTANRTVTLSTSNAKEGAHFVIVRGAGATGNFTLAVGSLATLRAPGEWCEVRYDAGTSAWILEKYGFLPTAGVQALSADKGDADATLTIGSSEASARWASALSADRTATLATTGAWPGAKFRVIRQESASGAFALNVVVGSTRLLRLAPGQWADFECTGSTWILTGFGDVRPNLNTLVRLRDDFVGEEIDSYRWQSLIGTDPSCVQAVMLADQERGLVRLTTGADAGGTMALNGVQLHSQLNWRADQGMLVWEGRVRISAITSVAVFIGLTDQRAALEMPFTLGAGDALTSNATNAAGVLFDTGADIDRWWVVGVAADVDAAKQDSAVAPSANTFETWRIELSAAGVATFYRNGAAIGSAMIDALTASALLTPVVAAFSRGAASRNVDVDLIDVSAIR